MTKAPKSVTLKALAQHLGLSPTTISMVLNDAPGAKTIAAATKQRVHDAALQLQYRPNIHAHLLGARHGKSTAVEPLEDPDNIDLSPLNANTRRLYDLELENAHLKRLVAELRLDKAILKGRLPRPSTSD